GSNSNIVQGNYIGTNYLSNAAVPNQRDGVSIEAAAQYNIIGGTTPVTQNTISGNNGNGVYIVSPYTSFNVVLGNVIGTDVSGRFPVGNANGVYVGVRASNNYIGNPFSGTGNVISGNRQHGVVLTDSDTSYNT